VRRHHNGSRFACWRCARTNTGAAKARRSASALRTANHFGGLVFGVAFGPTFEGFGRAKKRLKQANRSSSSFRNLQSATSFATGGFGFGSGAKIPS